MSERRFAELAIVLSLLGAPLAAQSTPQLEARLRRLEAREKVLKDSIVAVDQGRFDAVPRRYFHVGGLTFGFPVEVADAAEQALAEVKDDWSARYGSALSLLADDTLKFMIEPPSEAHGVIATITWRSARLQGESMIRVDEVAHGRWFIWLPAQALRNWETSLLGPGFRSWLNAAAPPLDAEGDDRLARSDLMFSHSGPARRCYEGSTPDCLRALALRDGADPYTEWYDPADLVAMVRDQGNDRAAGRAICLSTGDVDACRRARGGNTGFLPAPVRAEVRGSLYLYALAQGGPDALARLHAVREEPPARQLSVASGMSIDALVAGWHKALVSKRPITDPVDQIRMVGVTALWSVVLLALFAWRFRWHHV